MAIDWTKPVETIDGKPIRVLATDIKDTYYPIVIAVTNHFGDAETVETVTPTGYLTKANEEACRNLRVRNKKQKVWINLYGNPREKREDSYVLDIVGCIHKTIEQADYFRTDNIAPDKPFIAAVEVEI